MNEVKFRTYNSTEEAKSAFNEMLSARSKWEEKAKEAFLSKQKG